MDIDDQCLVIDGSSQHLTFKDCVAGAAAMSGLAQQNLGSGLYIFKVIAI